MATSVPDPSPPAASISVVVPTRDRPGSLAECLAALGRQHFDEPLEIVVVDDGSRQASEVAALVAAAPSARLVPGPGRGPAAARNAGVRAAVGELICFTDDDCEPAVGWVAALVARLRAGADAVAGTTVNPNPADRLAEASERVSAYVTEFSFRDGPTPFAPSNNLACRAAVLEAVAFDERYQSPGGEDRDWCARLARRGFDLVREPEAVVGHRQQLDLTGFWRRHARFGRAARGFAADHGPGSLPSPAGLYVGVVRDGFRGGIGVGALVCVAQMATASGYLAAALRRNRPQPVSSR
jgi:glycosyltransferase involved in cell wall biosynthesis